MIHRWPKANYKLFYSSTYCSIIHLSTCEPLSTSSFGFDTLPLHTKWCHLNRRYKALNAWVLNKLLCGGQPIVRSKYQNPPKAIGKVRSTKSRLSISKISYSHEASVGAWICGAHVHSFIMDEGTLVKTILLQGWGADSFQLDSTRLNWDV